MLSAQEAAQLTQEVRERNEESKLKYELTSVEGSIFEEARRGKKSCLIKGLLPQTLQTLRDNKYGVKEVRGEWVEISW